MAHQIEINTGTLQSVLNTINSLPEKIEGTVVKLNINPDNWSGTMWYINEKYEFKTLTITANQPIEIYSIRNSPVIMSGWGFNYFDTEPDAFIDYMDDNNNEGMYLFHFSEDTNIHILNVEGQ